MNEVQYRGNGSPQHSGAGARRDATQHLGVCLPQPDRLSPALGSAFPSVQWPLQGSGLLCPVGAASRFLSCFPACPAREQGHPTLTSSGRPSTALRGLTALRLLPGAGDEAPLEPGRPPAAALPYSVRPLPGPRLGPDVRPALGAPFGQRQREEGWGRGGLLPLPLLFPKEPDSRALGEGA